MFNPRKENACLGSSNSKSGHCSSSINGNQQYVGFTIAPFFLRPFPQCRPCQGSAAGRLPCVSHTCAHTPGRPQSRVGSGVGCDTSPSSQKDPRGMGVLGNLHSCARHPVLLQPQAFPDREVTIWTPSPSPGPAAAGLGHHLHIYMEILPP